MNTHNDSLCAELQTILVYYYLKLKELKLMSIIYELNPQPELGEQLHQVDKVLVILEDYIKKNLAIKNTLIEYLIHDGDVQLMFKVGIYESLDGLTIMHNYQLK